MKSYEEMLTSYLLGSKDEINHEFQEIEHPRDKYGRFKRVENSGTTTVSNMYTSAPENAKAALNKKRLDEYIEKQKNKANSKASKATGENSPRAYVERELHPGKVPYTEQVKRILQKFAQNKITLGQASKIISHKTKQRINKFLNKKFGWELNTN